VLELEIRAVKFLFFPRQDFITRPHPLPKKGASIIVVLPFLVRQI